MIARFFAPPPPARKGAVLVTRARAFEAAHAYRGAAFGDDRRVHGHNYVVTATVAGEADPRTDVVADLRAIDPLLREVTEPLDHRRIDVEYAPLRGREPGVEPLAVAIFGELARAVRRSLPRAALASVRVAETDDLWADHDGGDLVELTRAYGFSAAHRLVRPDLSDEENIRLYGKCANPQPHGHDYRFEVSVAGTPDPETGLVADLGALDRCVSERVLSRFDHRYLNVEVEPFDRVAPTGERIAEEIWRSLAGLGGLARVTVYETPRSAFTYRGPA